MDDTLDGTSVKDGPAGVQSSSQAVIVDRSASLSAQPRTNITATESVKAGPSTVKTCAQSLAEPISSLPPHLRRKKNGTTNGEASASTSSVPETTTSVPPHLRRKRNGTTNDNVSTTHSVTDRANSTIVTDGIVELSHAQLQTTPRVEPTPPASPSTTTVRQDTAIPFMETPSITQPSSQSDKPWVPLVVANFPSLPDSILSQIPPASTMTTFSYDFLLNELGGALHSPGLMFIAPPSLSPILTNRTYYTLNATVEPYLPSSPGQHGAKLTAFFNSNPEDDYDSVPVGCSFVSVPLFVCNSAFGGDKKGIAGSRYVYFGHYTQTRWSDKLDYDRMEQQVPQNVKQYWAEELAAAGRAKWVTEAMKTHFFPRPEYEGALPRTGANGEDNAEKVQKDMQKYVKVLGAWEKEANVKVGLIGRQDVLRAFEGADADEVPALRLWWEYLQCVAWEPKFYGGLVELQGRNQSYDEKK
ncbi:hypothetical protein B0J11DRAFT_438821 [Dendryphion nanum]|uniref:DUF6697 domain-containing protein n=1 Tax=Dendryphion nanum TaxID=256645 RepID=A0A9P9DKA9_9PLEO|nr:hypothetical protein B0J11DRAFT_438821 [Dendryphion nanum]